MKIDQHLVAFITGASSGFGWQVASDLLKAGAKVYLTDRNDEAKEFMNNYSKEQCIFREVDVTDEEGVKEAFQDCVNHFGYISVVVNSAGVGTKYLGILDEECNSSILKSVLGINVEGTFNVTKYAALQFVKQFKKGDKRDYLILNIGSVASTHASNGMVIYAASKGAVLGMTLPLARDLGKYGVRVVCLTPGFFNTPMTSAIPQRLHKARERLSALGRHGESPELSDAVQGIIQSSFLTGTFFHIDSSFASPHL